MAVGLQQEQQGSSHSQTQQLPAVGSLIFLFLHPYTSTFAASQLPVHHLCAFREMCHLYKCPDCNLSQLQVPCQVLPSEQASPTATASLVKISPQVHACMIGRCCIASLDILISSHLSLLLHGCTAMQTDNAEMDLWDHLPHDLFMAESTQYEGDLDEAMVSIFFLPVPVWRSCNLASRNGDLSICTCLQHVSNSTSCRQMTCGHCLIVSQAS